jgi:hypothetical protein
MFKGNFIKLRIRLPRRSLLAMTGLRPLFINYNNKVERGLRNVPGGYH